MHFFLKVLTHTIIYLLIIPANYQCLHVYTSIHRKSCVKKIFRMSELCMHFPVNNQVHDVRYPKI
jgi:hypothetical protein